MNYKVYISLYRLRAGTSLSGFGKSGAVFFFGGSRQNECHRIGGSENGRFWV